MQAPNDEAPASWRCEEAGAGEGGAIESSVTRPGEIDLATAAAWYVKHGLRIVPCEPRGKRPLIGDWLNAASCDPAAVAAWWARWPAANIGLPMRPNGLVAVDVDLKSGDLVDRATFVEAFGPVDGAAEAVTGSGGRHYVFRDPTDGNWSAGLGTGIDLRSNAQIVVAPSIHENGNRYVWDGTDGVRTLLHVADAPQWLLDCRKSERPASTPAGAEGELIPEGSRNNSLASIAGALRARGLSPAAIEAALLVENQERCKPPLQADEVRRIAASIGRYQPGPITTRGIDTRAARTPADALVLVNALPWWRGLQWGSFRRRGDALVGVTTCGHEVRFSMGKILRHTHAQERILADAGVAIASPRKGQVTAQWASVAELMVKAASVDAIDCGRGEDDLRADLARTWHGGGAEARNSREGAAGIAATLRSYRREPHAPNAPACVFTVGPEVWVHLGVFREWLTTPSGGARYRSLPELREAAGLLGLSPRVEDLETADGRRVQLTFWCGPASIVTEGAAD